jgi:hypothetical protein
MQEESKEKARILRDDYSQIEDNAMKSAALFWAEDLLGWIGVKEKVSSIFISHFYGRLKVNVIWQMYHEKLQN